MAYAIFVFGPNCDCVNCELWCMLCKLTISEISESSARDVHSTLVLTPVFMSLTQLRRVCVYAHHNLLTCLFEDGPHCTPLEFSTGPPVCTACFRCLLAA